MMKFSTISLLLLIISCFHVKAGTKDTVPEIKKELVLELLPGPNNPRNSEGDFITLKNGNILYIYTHFKGTSSGDFEHAFLASRYSKDKGKTWSKTDLIVVKNEGDMNVMSVSLLRLKNGEITLFYLIKNSEADCIPFMRISNDEGKTWSDPRPCITDKKGYFVLNNNRVIKLENGRLILAVALHRTPEDATFHREGKLFSYFSDDNGATWTSSQQVPNPLAVATQEPGLIELKNGKILMFVRTNANAQYFSYSMDDGATWSTVERSKIASPNSPASIVRIPSTGDLLMVWNNNGENQKRTPLNIAFSKDEGKTWNHRKTLENDPNAAFCYTAIHFVGKYILLDYSNWIWEKGIKITSSWQPKGTKITRGTKIAKLNLGEIYK